MKLFFNIFKIFKKAKNPESENLDFIIKRINFLQNEKPRKNRDELDIKLDLGKSYTKLSENLFKAVNLRDFNTIKKIICNNSLLKKCLVNYKGYNIIEYSLFNDDDELFKCLFENCYSFIISYFDNIPVLFTIILNRKNMDLIEFFLKENLLASSLNKENITNCFFVVLQINRRDLVDYIVKNFIDLLDARNIEASMIYSISHNQKDELSLIFSYPNLIKKFSNSNVEKMVAFSVMNQNIDALELMINNKHFVDIIENLDKDVAKNIFKIAYDKGNIFIIDQLMKSNKIKNNVKEVMKIENKK